ncbi:MAG: response regulator [Deltaproteobacteria bacterium]|nr:MAG: response regulator [Deltaproteobacteria bacterium]
MSVPLGSGVAAPLAAEAARRARRPLNILIIEDIEDSAWTLRDLLELEGHEVRIATDGGNGIELAIVVRPDVIVCDLGLPGIDGYEVAKRLRAAGSAAVLIALTGFASSEDVHRVQEAGFGYHLAKPADVENLLNILARV